MFSSHNKAVKFNSLVEAKKTQLLGYIRRENWDGLIDHLESTKGSILTLGASSTEIMTESLVTLQVSNGRNALHIVCCVHPPVEVVRAIINVCPSCIEGVDRNGYTPLHCAAEWGASPQVVACLIYNYPQATTATENRGKTPLILCCEFCCEEGACDTGLRRGERFVKGPLLGIIKALINAAPQIINEEDADGLSALEYAINKGTHVSVVKALQKASEEAWKDNRRATIAKEIMRRKLLESEQLLEAPLTVKPSELIKDMTPKTNLLIEYLAGNNPSRNFENDGEQKNVNSRNITQTENFSSIHSVSSPIESVESGKVLNLRTSIFMKYLAGNKNKKQSREEKSVGVEVDNVAFIDNNFSPKHPDAVKKFVVSKAA
mmetsp:Transcript_20112/g.28620  ORF Transcript_20112/g.28620 Transcript_20112/m.28620 type:complete len:376 (+) Transcript_20112:97-1224(+)